MVISNICTGYLKSSIEKATILVQTTTMPHCEQADEVPLRCVQTSTIQTKRRPLQPTPPDLGETESMVIATFLWIGISYGADSGSGSRISLPNHPQHHLVSCLYPLYLMRLK